MTLETIRAGGKASLARALARIESAPESTATLTLLDQAHRAARAHVVGMTGPPGVGKSTLMNALIAAWRSGGRTVGCIAVDPSSRRSGGALLGDRARLATDPDDPGVFVRSMAARDRLGGLADLTVAAMVLMRALFDIVLIETVGVGQSETDVATVADTVLFCIQPGSGDTLQFMKAGICEIPHLAVVTKADRGAEAERARADVDAALALASETADPGWSVPVLLVSAPEQRGIAALVTMIDRHAAFLDEGGRRSVNRHRQAESWLSTAVRERFGRDGLGRAGSLALSPGASPFSRLGDILTTLKRAHA